MGREQLLPELLPTGEELVDKLRRGPQETDAAVITRALALMGALQKYVEDDALVVMEPGAPIEDDLVRLKLPDPPDVIVQHRMDEESERTFAGLLRAEHRSLRVCNTGLARGDVFQPSSKPAQREDAFGVDWRIDCSTWRSGLVRWQVAGASAQRGVQDSGW